jgi:tungstate transport system substrate-binding protein
MVGILIELMHVRKGKALQVALVLVVSLSTVGIIYFVLVHKPQFTQSRVIIMVSTTTSLYQLGALNDLLNDFKNFTHTDVQFNILARGSGEALRLLADGATCFAFTHAPFLELQYLEQGKIERLAIFAYNEFIIVGPRTDPANISKAQNAIEAFKRIYYAGEMGLAKFVSRGDFSGTHVRELQLWMIANLSPEGKSWYLKSGQGMAQTLIMADNLQAYTLTDAGSWLNLKNQGKIHNLAELKRDPGYLLNAYSFYISKSPACSTSEIQGIAHKFREYLMSRGQDLLAQRYGGSLSPVKGREAILLQLWEELAQLR